MNSEQTTEQPTSCNWLPMCNLSCQESHTPCFHNLSCVFLTESSDCAPVKHLSFPESTPSKPLIHFSMESLGKRLVSHQIQVSVCGKHFTSHCTPTSPGEGEWGVGSGGGPISTSHPVAALPAGSVSIHTRYVPAQELGHTFFFWKPPHNAHIQMVTIV